MADFTAEELDRKQDKPRPKGRIPYPPPRSASLPEVRQWLSTACGLPPEVRIEAVVRPGREPEDPLTIVLSNEMRLRCPHQSRLQQARTLQAFLASESDGIAQPAYLKPEEVGDVYMALCRLGTAGARPDPLGDLHEHLGMFVAMCQEVIGSVQDRALRYVTIEAVRQRPAFNNLAARAMHNGHASAQPVLLRDPQAKARYVRALEWVAYLREIAGRKIDESGLVSRMAEIGSDRIDPQAWNSDRSHKTHLVFYTLPEGI